MAHGEQAHFMRTKLVKIICGQQLSTYYLPFPTPFFNIILHGNCPDGLSCEAIFGSKQHNYGTGKIKNIIGRRRYQLW